MSAVSYQQVMAWLDYWALDPKLSYDKWGREFNNIPIPPTTPPATYEIAAAWISTNYTGGPVPSPPSS